MKKSTWSVLGCAALLAIVGTAQGASAGASPQVSAENAFLTRNPGSAFYRTGDRITTVYGAAFGFGRTPRQTADAFLAQHAGLFNTAAADLVPGTLATDGVSERALYPNADGSMKFTLVSYLQAKDGIPVFRSDVRLLMRNEPGYPLVLARSATQVLNGFVPDQAVLRNPNVAGAFADAGLRFPGMVDFTPPRVVIWAGTERAPAEPTLAVEFVGTIGQAGDANYTKQLFVADAKTGKTLFAENQIFHIDINGTVRGLSTDGKKADTCDIEVSKPLQYARVTSGATTVFADVNGNFVLPNAGSAAVNVTSGIRGRWFRVFTPTADAPSITLSVTPPGPVNFLHNAANTSARDLAAVNAYHHANVVRDYALKYNPTYPTIGTQTEFRTNVMVSGSCNAYYDGASINFFAAGGGCPNMAYTDIVHHEYGHHLVQVAGSGQDSYGEGYGDLMGVLITDEPGLAYAFFGNCNEPLRDARNFRSYPCAGEIHDCGQLLSGCFWDTRNELVNAGVSDYRDQLGKWAMNSSVLHTGGDITPQITIDVMTLDDNDANILNGTPHYFQIQAGFSRHNMPGPDVQALQYAFPGGRPDVIDPDGGTSFTMQISPLNGFTLDTSSVKLLVDPEADGTFAEVPLSGSGTYTVTMPAAACGTNVRYYFTAKTTSNFQVNEPKAAPGQTFGAVSAVSSTVAFSDDFQTDKGWTRERVGGTSLSVGQWVRAVPGDFGNGDPDSDFDASGQCYVTGNALNANVANNVTFRLISPTLSALGGDYTLSYARWFSNGGGNDAFVVEASNDNGTTWVNVETVGPSGPGTTGGWITKAVDLGSKLPLTATMKVRFVATDASPDNVVEAGVDAFSLSILDCGSDCPADFNGDGFVTGDDFDAYVAAFSAGSASADFNGDGFVTGDDFDAFVVAFNAGC